MKKITLLFGLLILLGACSDRPIKKPEKLIDEAVMADIIYDLSVMEGMKSRNPELTKTLGADYIYKKYQIDSVQFAQNSQYYSADIDKYKKIYENVSMRLEQEKKATDSLVKKNGGKAIPPATTETDRPSIE